MVQVSLQYQLDLAPESRWLTVTPSPIAKSSILHVQELGDFLANGGYFTRRSGLESYLIKYTVSGEGILQYRGQTYTLKPNQIFWIDCREPQYYCTSPEAGNWRVLWVHFYGPTSAAYYEIFQAQNRGQPVMTLEPANRVSQAIQALLTLYSNPDNTLTTDIYASEYLLETMVDVIKNTDQQREWLGVPQFVQQVRSYLSEHYAERITLDDLAARFAVSKFHLQKQFKHYVGYSPSEYLLQVRLTRAKELLRTSDQPVAQIAADVGIQNTSYFINLFHKAEGITPAQYRTNWWYE